MVRSPSLRRPPVRFLTVKSGLCGLSVVRSSLTSEVWKRNVGVTGLYVLIAIVFVLSLVGRADAQTCAPISPFLRCPADSPGPRQVLQSGRFIRPGNLLEVAHILGQLLAGLQPDVSLLPVRAEARVLAAAALLAQNIGGADRGHLHLEERLDGLLDLGLRGVGGDVEHQRPLGFLHAQPLFGNQRAANHGIESRHYAASVCAASLRFDTDFSSASASCSMAALEKMARS